MLIGTKNLSKSIGARNLFKDLTFTVTDGEKIALVGRNGYGKTTLLKILSGEDQQFDGQIDSRKGLRITLTKQEHIHETEQSPLAYILNSVPNFHEYKKIIEDYEEGRSTNLNH